MNNLDPLRARAAALHLHGLLAHWSEAASQQWLAPLLGRSATAAVWNGA